MPMKVDSKDLGWERLKRELARAGVFKVKVGWPGDGGAHGGLTNAELATLHEFGSPRRGIPERPVLRQTYEANRPKLEQLLARQTQLVLDGKATVEQALGIIGAWFAARLKGQFREGSFARLKPATIARKGSDRPLIDTGQLRNSVAWVVIKA